MHRASGRRIGALFGLTTTLMLAGVLYLLAQLQLATFVPLDLAEAVVLLAPGALATQAIELFGGLAKIVIEITSGVIFLSMGTLGGVLIARQRFASPLSSGLLAGLIGLIATAMIQMVANQLADGRALAVTALAVLGWGVLLGWSVRQACATSPAIAARHLPLAERRAFLWRSSGILLTLAASSAAIGELLRQAADESSAHVGGSGAALPGAALPSPRAGSTRSLDAATMPTGGLIEPSTATVAPNSRPAPTVAAGAETTDDRAFTPGSGARPKLTATPDLYVVQATFSPPRADTSQWQLIIKGLVDRPLTLSYADLRALPPIDQTSTLTCVSNPVGGPLIGTIRWTGVPLRDLLAQAGVQLGTVDVVLRGMEGYADSIPLERAMNPHTLIAYGMNGAALTRNHGFPARAIVPGIYGMKNVKWLHEIELVSADFQGFWQKRGWSDTAVVKTQSVIDTGNPALGNKQAVRLEHGALVFGGYAFAGDRGIERVEIQIDDGAWQPAQTQPVTSPLAWRAWRYVWNATPGDHTVMVRATDGAGQQQSAASTPPHPDGASGWQRLTITVTKE